MYWFEQPMARILVAIPDKMSIPVVQPPLEPNMKIARVLLPNSGQPTLEVSVGPSDTAQHDHTNLKTNTTVEYCARWNNCLVLPPSAPTSTAAFVSAFTQSPLPVQRPPEKKSRNSVTCNKTRTVIPIDVNFWCAGYWKPCHIWNQAEGKCFINVINGSPDEGVNIHNNPCWFRVKITNASYNRSTLLRTPPHSQILTPKPVHFTTTASQYYCSYDHKKELTLTFR